VCSTHVFKSLRPAIPCRYPWAPLSPSANRSRRPPTSRAHPKAAFKPLSAKATLSSKKTLGSAMMRFHLWSPTLGR